VLAAAAKPLVVRMDSTPLFDDCAFLPGARRLSPTAGRDHHAALGAAAIVLANHGILTAGRHAEAASGLHGARSAIW
jgi:hypothetical protein